MIITSRPGNEFQAMLPENLERYRHTAQGSVEDNPDYLLFDDLILLSGMQREHDTLTAILAAAVGPQRQMDFRQLLATALAEPHAVSEAVEGALELEKALYGASESTLERPVISSQSAAVSALRITQSAVVFPSAVKPFSVAAPNTLFARDLGVVIGDALLLTYAAEAGRRRDMLLSRIVWTHHPLLTSKS